LLASVLRQLIGLQIARRHHKQHAQLARQTIQGISQSSYMPTVVDLVLVAIAEVEDLAAVLFVQVAHGFLDRFLDELGVILLFIVFKHLAREQAQLWNELRRSCLRIAL